MTPVELLDWAISNIDPRDEAAMISASEKLAELQRNRDFFIEALRFELESAAAGGSTMSRMTSSQAFSFGAISCGEISFVIRCALWIPVLARTQASVDLYNKTYSYLTPHNHNFSLLTIGYHGPGYETTIYEYNREQTKGCAGEHIEVKFRERTRLSEGKIIYFRPLIDIHTQLHPTDTSISLNLIGEHDDHITQAQYEFDLNTPHIRGPLNGNVVTKQLIAFKLAAELTTGDEFTDILEYIARRHHSEHIRTESIRTLLRVAGSDRDRWEAISVNDTHPYVRGLCSI
ncbi:MAG TPA: hypothetical protein VGM81_20855 [Burkholderiaceae bacterium]|jgi:hypothetical protein